jgi:hypothetical protein
MDLPTLQGVMCLQSQLRVGLLAFVCEEKQGFFKNNNEKNIYIFICSFSTCEKTKTETLNIDICYKIFQN